jgi:hypothetical protein
MKQSPTNRETASAKTKSASQRHMKHRIASGKVQERPRNDIWNGRLLRNVRSQRHR